MDKIYEDFKYKDVVFYNLYTREPHPGQKFGKFDFSNKKQTKSFEERLAYAKEMIKERNQKRPIIIDTFGKDCIQNSLGGRMPNSLVVIDKNGKIALWQDWSNSRKLRAKLEEMTETKREKN